MRHFTMLLMSGILAGSLVAGCSSDTPTSPSTPAPSPTPSPSPTPTPAPAAAAVTVGDIFFKSGHNGSSNPAVDTVAVNGTVTWTWGAGESLPHSVQSLGSPSFTRSGVQTGAGSSYHFVFPPAGTYHYNCGVHGNLMTGTIVVAAASTPSSTPTPQQPAPSPAPPTG